MSSITVYYNSPIGEMEITAAEGQITSMSFVDTVNNTVRKPSPVLKEIIKQLDEYFAGGRKAFDIDMYTQGTDFQLRVWHELLKIPYGTVISYSELAQKLDNKDAVRAVASAVAANKLAILIPCHRVIGKGGALTGYRWGLERKKRLLEHEKGNL